MLSATAPAPACTMKIFMSNTQHEIVAENVKIGDRLTLSVSIDEQGWWWLVVVVLNVETVSLQPCPLQTSMA